MARANELLNKEFVKTRPRWESEIKIMLKTGKKAEIQALRPSISDS